MDAKTSSEKMHLGFLATLSLPERAFVGGLLVTNRLGRPLEFQCTAPVQPNKTQILLFGPTLEPYVLADLIGKTLIERVSVKPDLLLIDSAKTLSLRELTKTPIACLCDEEQPRQVAFGRHSVLIHGDFPADRDKLAAFRQRIPAEADLAEPFERVRAALKEATGSAVAKSPTLGAA